jgi:hypothetical protein
MKRKLEQKKAAVAPAANTITPPGQVYAFTEEELLRDTEEKRAAMKKKGKK